MTDKTAPIQRFAIGRMTATERAAGRFMRTADGHPPAAPAAPVEPAATAVPVTPPAAIMAPAEAAPVAAPSTPARPEGLPDSYWDDAAGVKPEAYSRLAELEAADASRREGVPASAAEYSLDLPEPVVGLDGQPVAIDAADPLAQAILPALHEAGVPQAAVSKIVQAYASAEVAAAKAEAEQAAAFVKSEQTKLGAEHVKRTAALHGQITAAVGAEAAEALRSQMRSAEAVIALETLVSKLQAPAIGAPPLQAPASPDLATRLYG